jgi:hypothetical protein
MTTNDATVALVRLHAERQLRRKRAASSLNQSRPQMPKQGRMPRTPDRRANVWIVDAFPTEPKLP